MDAHSGMTSPLRVDRFAAQGAEPFVFDLAVGDRVRIIDPEGRQPGLLWVLGDVEAHGLRPATNVDDSAASDALAGHDADLSRVSRFRLFSGDGGPGASVSFEAVSEAICVLLPEGSAMTPDEQAPPTELIVEIETAVPAKGVAPKPLAEPKLDLRVQAATASAYRVKAGDYIQIIDVDGRQCSDFLAFDAAALEAGEEFGLDPTVTRTLMATANPGPGLHSKYFDARLKPLVEIVRDTVGRHDAFLLACNSKYYEDMGYPGHDNCTDNFNRTLAPYGIKPKAGWPAINFFYNTCVGDDDSITMDEPWSRPGDYVLLRALTDLVCASSSCTDDIDPANGWSPTDIHVRVYDASENFSRGIAHRMTPDAAPRLTRETGFHPRTSALTRKLSEYRGFWLADCYSDNGPIEEYWACRERVAIMDLSPLRKFEVIGPDAEALMQLAVTRNMKKLAINQIVYTAMCHPHGGMIDDGTVFRIGQNNFRWICGDDYCGVHLRELAQKHELKVWVKTATDQLSNVGVQGPRSREILENLVVTPPAEPTVRELKWFRFTVGRLEGIPVVVSRTGYTGELGYEVFCHPSRAPELWDAIMKAGEPHGIKPLGLLALDMLRIEAGLAFAGYEFCDQTDPFEAGIGFAVPKEKTDPYVGSEALARRRETPSKKLVGLEVATNEAIGHGDCVHVGRAQIGVVTSGTRSPILGKTIALARLDVTYADLGQQVDIGKLDGQQKRIKAIVVAFPHYDPTKSRVRTEAESGPVSQAPASDPASVQSEDPRGSQIRA